MKQPFAASRPSVEPVVVAGCGSLVVRELSRLSGRDAFSILTEIASDLLVQKGADWTLPITGEYLGIYPDSAGTFVVLWDRISGRCIAHGALLQSARFAEVGLVAHIRTRDEFQGRGLGRMVIERLAQWAFEHGADLLVLGTDDKLLRLDKGERAASGFYAKIGFAVLAEKRLADTVEWLMALEPAAFRAIQAGPAAPGPQSSAEPAARTEALPGQLKSWLANRLTELPPGAPAEPVRAGDLAGLFLLLNACPPDDFEVKLSAWDVQAGPDLERQFVVSVRPALADQDRVEDASLVLRNASGWIVAVCAARRETPFTRGTFRLDFYCLPALLRTQPRPIRELVERVIARISASPGTPGPLRLAFWGADAAKVRLFKSLGFAPTPNEVSFLRPQTGVRLTAREYERLAGGR